MMTPVMIKKEDLKDAHYYIGASPQTHIAMWDAASGFFYGLIKAEETSTPVSLKIPHYEDNEEKGFFPRGEALSMYVMLRNLLNIMMKCTTPGWDGDTATSICLATFRKIAPFLENLLLTTAAPRIGAEINGSTTLEWFKNVDNKLIINIDDTGTGTYYAKSKEENWDGVFPIVSEVPDFILDIIRNIT
jgi:hypothetical protein